MILCKPGNYKWRFLLKLNIYLPCNHELLHGLQVNEAIGIKQQNINTQRGLKCFKKPNDARV